MKKIKLSFQQLICPFFLCLSFAVQAQGGFDPSPGDRDKPDRSAKSESKSSDASTSSEKLSPSDKGTCKEWERANFSDKEHVTKEHETTRAQCERIDKQAKEAVGNLAGAKFEAAQVETSTKSETSNCDLPKPKKNYHRLPN